jgi:hypothetical protein
MSSKDQITWPSDLYDLTPYWLWIFGPLVGKDAVQIWISCGRNFILNFLSINILKQCKVPWNLKRKLPNIKSVEKTFSVKMQNFLPTNRKFVTIHFNTKHKNSDMCIGTRINCNIEDSCVHSVSWIFAIFCFYEIELTNTLPFVINSWLS